MKINFLFYFLLCSGSLIAQEKQIDWPNLSKYAISNDTMHKTDEMVVFIGNSITEIWPQVMPKYFKENNFIGRGISGQTSPQVLLRFRNDVVNLGPKAVVINIGINDIAENTGPYNEEFVLNNISSMVEIALANDIQVILASVLPASSFPWRPEIENVAQKVIDLNKGIKGIANAYSVQYLNYYDTLKNDKGGLDPSMAEDGVHPTEKCYLIMSELALNALYNL